MVASKTLSVVVITPERQVVESPADSVVLPAHDGELGVLPRRAPLLCELGTGELRYRSGGEFVSLFVDGGFAQVVDNKVIVLSDFALLSEEVTTDALAGANEAALRPAATPELHERLKRRAAALQRYNARVN